jgi:hypothetical protein
MKPSEMSRPMTRLRMASGISHRFIFSSISPEQYSAVAQREERMFNACSSDFCLEDLLISISIIPDKPGYLFK